jgi:hypothetical protein
MYDPDPATSNPDLRLELRHQHAGSPVLTEQGVDAYEIAVVRVAGGRRRRRARARRAACGPGGAASLMIGTVLAWVARVVGALVAVVATITLVLALLEAQAARPSRPP